LHTHINTNIAKNKKEQKKEELLLPHFDKYVDMQL